MAETESAAKRTREAPKGPVRPEPAPVEAEQESEARARQLVGLLRSESAAAAPPDEGNGHGPAAMRRALGSGNGDGNGHRAVQPADLITLQRLAGNAAVADLMVPPAKPDVQRAAMGPAAPEPVEPDVADERKAAKKEVSEAVRAWFAAPPSTVGKREAAGGSPIDCRSNPDGVVAGSRVTGGFVGPPWTSGRNPFGVGIVWALYPGWWSGFAGFWT
jgi:hypothetical protein